MSYEWTHTMADIINSLNEAGLRIEFFHEFPSYDVVRCPGGAWRATDKAAAHPLMFSLKVTQG